MRYISTRGQAPPVSFIDAMLAGMAPDGGLYVPEQWPALAGAGAQGGYFKTAAEVLKAFAGADLAADECAALCHDAYVNTRWPEAVTPLRQIGETDWLLDLSRGPSLSFKDIAMQLIGPLFDHVLAKRSMRLSVVCATSGDTGAAAVEALKGRERVDLFVLTPKGRVSDVQRRFMTTSGAANLYVIEINDDFDACQAIVKSMFADADFAERARLSAVNSINWARIAAQSTYYHVAAHALCAYGPVSFVVPTGNFGDAYAGWVAKQMGAPIGKIVLAVNSNDILARALNQGRYERTARSRATLSPAMDIQVASNFERILFEAVGRDAGTALALYNEFARSGGFEIPAPALARLREDFAAASVSDDDTLKAMQAAYDDRGYLACPHTAVGLEAKWRLDMPLDARPVVTLATAHPAKFPDTVERATGVRPQLPARCADLFEREERFDALPADAKAVNQYIRERSRAWS